MKTFKNLFPKCPGGKISNSWKMELRVQNVSTDRNGDL